MNVREKIEQVRRIRRSSRSPAPLILDLLRMKRSDYVAECRGLTFELNAGCHEWYTLYENVIREDYFSHGVVVGQGDTVVDIGANFGSFATIAARKVGPTGTVVAFEPNPEICGRLARNVGLNGLTQIEVRNEAVSGEDGEIVLFIQPRSSLSTAFASIDDRASEATRPVAVEAVSLRSVLDSIGGPIDLLKIDCEGAEYDILNGLDHEGARRIRQITMEVHKVEGHGEHEIGARLRTLGFTVTDRLPMLTAVRTV